MCMHILASLEHIQRHSLKQWSPCRSNTKNCAELVKWVTLALAHITFHRAIIFEKAFWLLTTFLPSLSSSLTIFTHNCSRYLYFVTSLNLRGNFHATHDTTSLFFRHIQKLKRKRLVSCLFFSAHHLDCILSSAARRLHLVVPNECLCLKWLAFWIATGLFLCVCVSEKTRSV